MKGTNYQNWQGKKVDNLNRPISIKEIELINNNLPKQKVQGPNGLTDKFYQTYKEKLYQFSITS